MKNRPTESELEILTILWEHGPSTVRFINDEINQQRKVGYTTTLKIMQIMYEKDLLSRESEGRSHVYAPLVQQTHAQKNLLESLLHTAFNGSASSLVLQALGNHNTTKEELEQIKKLIDQLEGEK